MLEYHYHPIMDFSLIITPHFLGGSILSTFSPFVQGEFISSTCSSFPRIVHIFYFFFLSEEIPYLWLVLPFWKEFVSSTCFLFLRRVHIFNLFLLFKKGLYNHCSSLQGNSVVSSSFFLLMRKVFSINITIPPWEESLFKLHQDFHEILANVLATFSSVLTY